MERKLRCIGKIGQQQHGRRGQTHLDGPQQTVAQNPGALPQDHTGYAGYAANRFSHRRAKAFFSDKDGTDFILTFFKSGKNPPCMPTGQAKDELDIRRDQYIDNSVCSWDWRVVKVCVVCHDLHVSDRASCSFRLDKIGLRPLSMSA